MRQTEKLPQWAKKPFHRSGTVVATETGWVVKESGELLVSVKNLDKKLAEYLGVEKVSFEENKIVVQEVIESPEETGMVTPPAVEAPQGEVVQEETQQNETKPSDVEKKIVGDGVETNIVEPEKKEVKEEVEPKKTDVDAVKKEVEGDAVKTETPVKRKAGRPKKVKTDTNEG